MHVSVHIKDHDHDLEFIEERPVGIGYSYAERAAIGIHLLTRAVERAKAAINADIPAEQDTATE